MSCIGYLHADAMDYMPPFVEPEAGVSNKSASPRQTLRVHPAACPPDCLIDTCSEALQKPLCLRLTQRAGGKRTFLGTRPCGCWSQCAGFISRIPFPCSTRCRTCTSSFRIPFARTSPRSERRGSQDIRRMHATLGTREGTLQRRCPPEACAAFMQRPCTETS
jgi:hypothetical protein